MSGPRIRDRHARPPRFRWLVPLIVVLAVLIVLAGLVVSAALGVRWF